MAKSWEKMQGMVGRRDAAPISKLIGFTITAISEGEAVIDFTAGPEHANPMGTLHGGILCDIADAAMGIAFASALAEGDSFTTLELKINYLKPVWNADLRATATIVKNGKTVGLVQCDIVDSKGALVARASSTCLTLRGEMAKGRAVPAGGEDGEEDGPPVS